MRRAIVAVALAAFGVWMVTALLGRRAENGIPTDPVVAGLMAVGNAVLMPIPYLRGLGRRIAQRNAEFWSVPVGVVTVALWWSFGTCLASAWMGLVLVVSG